MAKYPSTSSTPIAIERYSEMTLPFTHASTSNFMELSVAGMFELVPKQTFNVEHHLFNRFAAMPIPTFGLARTQSRAFFVPNRVIFPGFEDMIEDTTHVFDDGTTDTVVSVPTIPNSLFVSLLIQSSNSIQVDPDEADFVLLGEGGALPVAVGRKFTVQGRRYYKLLRQLGYKFSFNRLDKSFDRELTAMPLFALAKVYLDWYYPSNYLDSDIVGNVKKWLEYNSSTPLSQVFSITDLSSILQLITFVCYDDDYVVSAWDNPQAPTDGAFSSVSIPDVTSANASQVYTDSNGTPVIAAGNPISQFAIDSLKAVTDYLKRHQISGARVLDRYLSRFGVVLDNAKLKRSSRLQDSTEYVNFHDVVSTSDTAGAQLGDYAGKGIGENDLKFNFSTDDYGFLFVLSTIVPRSTPVEGISRSCTRLTKFDFWTPEFDNVGVQALPVSEVYLPEDSRKMYPSFNPTYEFEVDSAERVFGFLPRYAEYKYSRDMVTGDYALNSLRAGNEGWTLNRQLDSLFETNGFNTAHNVNFLLGTDAEQYNRIFYNTSSSEDKFNIVHVFNIKTNFPGRKLYDTYEFESEGAPRVSVDVGGSKAN